MSSASKDINGYKNIITIKEEEKVMNLLAGRADSIENAWVYFLESCLFESVYEVYHGKESVYPSSIRMLRGNTGSSWNDRDPNN